MQVLCERALHFYWSAMIDVTAMVRLGMCPACGEALDDGGVKDINFRGTVRSHTAYRCRKCDTVIGFSSSQP